jgi:hypothetical protein
LHMLWFATDLNNIFSTADGFSRSQIAQCRLTCNHSRHREKPDAKNSQYIGSMSLRCLQKITRACQFGLKQFPAPHRSISAPILSEHSFSCFSFCVFIFSSVLIADISHDTRRCSGVLQPRGIVMISFYATTPGKRV